MTRIVTQPDSEVSKVVATEFASNCGLLAALLFLNLTEPIIVYNKSLGNLDLDA
jgi:hypothetical protein